MIEPALRDVQLLDDITEAADKLPEALHLWWIGQSGFVVAQNDDTLVIDPYLSDSLTQKYSGTDRPHVRMSERVMAPEILAMCVHVVVSSHAHTDHMDAQTLVPLMSAKFSVCKLVVPQALHVLALELTRFVPEYVIGIDAGKTVTVWRYEIHAIPAAHDKLQTDSRGRHLCLGYVIKHGGFAVYHSGDTVVYHGLVDLLRPHKVDIAILPINGKLGNMNGIEAARLAKDIGAKIVIPCHYDMFEFNTANPYEEFVPECERIGQPYRVLKLGERFTYPEAV